MSEAVSASPAIYLLFTPNAFAILSMSIAGNYSFNCVFVKKGLSEVKVDIAFINAITFIYLMLNSTRNSDV